MGALLVTGALFLLLLLAFGLRVYGLARQSLWLDEGASYAIASSSIFSIFDQTFTLEPNPPLYYVLLHVWMSVAGSSEFALRFLSVVPGTALIPVLYRLGDELAGRKAGLVAALLAAGSPYLVWYAQEARMYALLGLLTASSALALARAARTGSPSTWMVFFTLCLATMYTHLYGLFGVGAVLAVAFVAGRGRRHLARWGVCALGLGVGYAPWLWATFVHRSEAPSWRVAVDAADVVSRSAASFAHGMFLSGTMADVGTWAGLALATAGVAAGFYVWRHGVGTRSLVVSLITVPIVVPLLSSYLGSRVVPIYAERYVSGVAPYYYLAIGVSASFFRRGFFAMAIAAGAVVLYVPALHAGWTDTQFTKEEFRTAAAFVQERAHADDVVVLAAPYIEMPFRYYYHGAAKVVPFGGSYADPEGFLAPELAHRSTVWLVTSHLEDADPDRKLAGWMASRFPENTEAYPKGIHINAYDVSYRLSSLPDDAAPTDVRFEGGLRLVGYRVDEALPARDTRLHPPSNWLHVTLFWSSERPPQDDFRSEALLLDDSAGIWGGKLHRPADVASTYPARTWIAGEIVVDDVDININPATPPGQYRVAVGLTDSNGGAAHIVDSAGVVTDRPLQVLASVSVLAQ